MACNDKIKLEIDGYWEQDDESERWILYVKLLMPYNVAAVAYVDERDDGYYGFGLCDPTCENEIKPGMFGSRYNNEEEAMEIAGKEIAALFQRGGIKWTTS